MAAPYHGKTSSAWWITTKITQVTGWTCSLTCSTADSTARSADTFGRTRKPGYIGGTATVTAKLYGDSLPQQGATADLQLLRGLTNAEKGYQGTATCTGASPSLDRDGIGEVTYEFQWNGTVSATTTLGTG